MAKQHKLQLRTEEDPLTVSERAQKQKELRARFPGGIAEIRPIMTRYYNAEKYIENARPEDMVRFAGATSIPVPVSQHHGTSPSTGLPIYSPKTVLVRLGIPASGVRGEGITPIVLRTDAIKGLSPFMDKWEVLEFFADHPLCDKDFTVKPIDPALEKKLRDEAKKPGARAILKEIAARGTVLAGAQAGPPPDVEESDDEADLIGEVATVEEEEFEEV